MTLRVKSTLVFSRAKNSPRRSPAALPSRKKARCLCSTFATRRKDGLSKTERMQVAFAHHLLDVARAYPAAQNREVVLVIDNAPWHRGRPVNWAPQRCPRLTL